jgi:hypothetical protein
MVATRHAGLGAQQRVFYYNQLSKARYIRMNPVRAELVNTMEE